MRRRSLALIASFAACFACAATASADPLTAGDYTAQLTTVSVRLGSSLIPTQTFPLPGLPTIPFTVPDPPVPVNVSFGNVTVPTIDISGGQLNAGSVLSVTVVGPVTLSADPVNGSGSAAAAGYGDATIKTALVNTTCHLGDASHLISGSLSTENPGGSRYDAATGAVTVADHAVQIPVSTCDGTFGGAAADALNLVAGLPTAEGILSFTGVIVPKPASTTSSDTPTPGSSDTPAPGPGTPTQQGEQQGGGGQQAAGCIVPKLKGKKLKRAKKLLKKAHCRLGKVKKKKNPKKAGRVLSQKPKPGTRRARGARVRVTVGRR